MAVRVFNVILVLVLSLVTLGECGSVPCKISGAIIDELPGKTADEQDFECRTHVPQSQRYHCYNRCKDYCIKEGHPACTTPNWVDCEAFSSYVELGGTCWCYGWISEPSWYDDADYTSGVCRYND